MPEAPEVEIVRRGLLTLSGSRIAAGPGAVRVYCKKLRDPIPENFSTALQDRVIGEAARRGKYLIVPLGRADHKESGCTTALFWLIHLGMSGSLHIDHICNANQSESPVAITDSTTSDSAASEIARRPDLPRHTHIVVHLVDGRRLYFTDPRRFGRMALCDADSAAGTEKPGIDKPGIDKHGDVPLPNHPWLRQLGPEPDSMDMESFVQCIGKSRASIKAAIMDQKNIAGIGNIYALEALWQAGIHPNTRAHTVTGPGLEQLLRAVQSVLQAGLESGGASIKDFVTVDGAHGAFQDRFRVYGRGGEPCMRSGCSGRIVRFRQQGRSSFVCPVCQVDPPQVDPPRADPPGTN